MRIRRNRKSSPSVSPRYTLTSIDVPRVYDNDLMERYEERSVGTGRTGVVLSNGDTVIKINIFSFEMTDELQQFLADHDLDSAIEYAIENGLDDEIVFAFIEIKNFLIADSHRTATGMSPSIPLLIAIGVVHDTEENDDFLALELNWIPGKRMADKLEEVHGGIRDQSNSLVEKDDYYEDLKALLLGAQDLAAALDFLTQAELVDMDLNLNNILVDFNETENFYTMTKIDLGSVRPQSLWGADIEYTGASQYLPWGELSSDYLEALWFKDQKQKSGVTNAVHQHSFARAYYEMLSGKTLMESTESIELTLDGTLLVKQGINNRLVSRFPYFDQVLNIGNFNLGLKFKSCATMESLLYAGITEDDAIFDFIASLVDYAYKARKAVDGEILTLQDDFETILDSLAKDPKAVKRICDILGLSGRPSINRIINLLLTNEFNDRLDSMQTLYFNV